MDLLSTQMNAHVSIYWSDSIILALTELSGAEHLKRSYESSLQVALLASIAILVGLDSCHFSLHNCTEHLGVINVSKILL